MDARYVMALDHYDPITPGRLLVYAIAATFCWFIIINPGLAVASFLGIAFLECTFGRIVRADAGLLKRKP